MILTTPTRYLLGAALAVLVFAAGLAAAPAHANTLNSLQPAHVYFGDVIPGNHPNRLVTLHNGTGAAYTLETIAISGSGGGKFTLVGRSALLDASPYPRCKAGLTLEAGARCVFDVRVRTTRSGWWRSVLSVVPSNGEFNSAELRAHVLTGGNVNRTPAHPCSKWSIAGCK